MKSRISLLLFSVITFSQFGCDSVFDGGTDFDERNRVTGKYVLDEYSQTYNADFTYDIEILKSNQDNNEIYILNFYDSDVDVLAIIEEDKVFIPYQEKGALEIEGVGTVYGNVIELNYSVFDSSQSESFPDYCTTVATRIK